MGDDYTLHETENKTGTTGENTAAAAKTYDGFLEANTFEQQVIAADGSTVVRIYYDRVSYPVHFEHDGTSAEIDNQTIRHEGKLTEPETPKKTGYDFVCWTTEDGRVWNFAADTVTGEFTLTAQWKAAENTCYTVNHYQERVDGSPSIPN